MQDETVWVGRILKPHGVGGEVKVEILSDFTERFAVGNELILGSHREVGKRLEIASSRFVPGGVLVRFHDVADRDQAADLRGATLEIERSRVPQAPAGAFYYFDLVGCRCFDHAHGDLGQVDDLIDDGGGILLLLRKDDEVLLLVPFVEAFLTRVSVAEKRIDLDLPAGLVETCRSTS